MRTEDPVLGKATRLIAREKWGEAIELLEPEIVRYRDSFRYYYILGYACMLSGDWGGAATYFKRASDIRMRDPELLFALAAVYLRRGESDRAIERYLEILEVDKGNKRARRALDFLRRHASSGTDECALDLRGGTCLLPPAPRTRSTPGLAATLAVAALVAIVALGGLWLAKVGPFSEVSAREGISELDLSSDEKAKAVELGGAYRYVLTEREVVQTFEKAQRLFLEYRDQEALVELNRILLSNAAAAVKRKAKLLSEQATAPSFADMKSSFSYQDVARDPQLYQDCHVLWSGMVANLKEGDAFTSFELLVGYDKRNALEGVVPVAFSFAVPVDSDAPLELLGKVDARGGKLRLAGVALHQRPGETPRQ